LLIACANIANLLLARAETRRREFALLIALGAGRARLARKVLAESVILSLAGGVLGVILARAGVIAIVRAYPSSFPRIGEVTIDFMVMLASIAVAVICGILFGSAPLLNIRSGAMAESLKSGGRGSSGTTRHHVRRTLVIAETAIAVIVVVGAGLLVQTVRNLTAVDAGFERSRLATFSISLPRARFDNLVRVRAFQRILDQLRAVPGVEAASAMSGLPLDRPVVFNQTEITNFIGKFGPLIASDYQRVMSGFFETTRIPIVQGRGFQSIDVGSDAGVAVVNEALANAFWQGQNPIGQRLRPGGTMPWLTVIGVAKDVKQTGIDKPVRPEVYALVDQIKSDTLTSFLSISPTTMHVVLRTTLPLESLAPTIQQAVRDVDPAVPVARLREMQEVFTESIRGPRLLAQLLTLFSILALLLAAVGIYGLLSYTVAERRREIGIRLAIGATRSATLMSVMRQGLVLTTTGIVIGLVAAFALNTLLASLLFGVKATDATTLIVATAVISLVGAVACWIPAWRASRLDPNIMLRNE
jgi:predicted permease